ncbi:MAG TPA: peptide synthase [Opitutae bacterium]|nr:peptide synthase [Opitutae bacterium]
MPTQPFRGNLAQHLFKNAKNKPSAIAVISHQNKPCHWTFKDLHQDVVKCASFFLSKGIRKADRTLLMVNPGYDLIVYCFALLYIGSIPIIIDPGMGLFSLLKCVRRSKPKVLLTIPLIGFISWFFRKTFSTVKIKLPLAKNFISKIKNIPLVENLKNEEADDSDLAAIVFTSGSTGSPKGVRYLHKNFNAQIQVLKDIFGITEGEIDLVTLPVFSLFNPALGVTSVIPEMNPRKPAKAEACNLLEAIKKYKTTSAFCSPIIGSKIMDFCEKHREKLPNMNRIMLAGAPSSPYLISSLSTYLPNGRVIVPYGATEALPVSYSDHVTIKQLSKSTLEGEGSNLGKAVQGISILLFPIRNSPLPNESDETIKPLKEKFITGEICVSGETVTDGYDHMPGATRDARFTFNGKEYHRMGDLGYWDKDKNLRFMGRKAECVLTESGPLETERCEPIFNEIKGVKRCALIGIGHDKLKEPSLVVEIDKKVRITKEEVKEEILNLLTNDYSRFGITKVYFEKKLPVDARHNAKIHRLSLSKKWTSIV